MYGTNPNTRVSALVIIIGLSRKTRMSTIGASWRESTAISVANETNATTTRPPQNPSDKTPPQSELS